MRRSTFHVLVCAALCVAVGGVCATPLRAQASLVSATRPAATVADFRWLAGRWEGRMTGNTSAVAEVTFSSPNAGLIVGMMRLVQRDTVLVIELISIVDTPAGVEMRFRHFSTQLDVYEARFKQAMRLTAHTPDRDTFENLVAYDKELMSTQPRVTMFIRKGVDAFVGHSDIVGDDGKPGVVEVTYQRGR